MGHGDGRSHGAKLNLRARLAYLAAAIAGVAVLTGLPLGNAAVGNTALQLNGSSQYATLGASGDLQSATFTVELWFQRTGAGTPTSTGTGGITNAIPLITKGRAEAETAAADVNYFLGIDATSGKLVADFEEGQSGSTPSANHPITGTTAIPIGSAWHHAAATYDGAAWNLYLDGALDGTLTVNKPANAATTSRTAVGSALTTAGVAAGFFAGVVDEVRIWNSARTLAQIQATKNTEITAPQSGLLGVWNLNEGTGSSLADNSGNGKTGAAIASPAWVAGFVPPGANNPPVAVADSYSTPQSTTLTVAAPGVLANDTDPESNPLTAIKVTDPAHGTLTLASNGSVNYVPTPGYNGPDSFTYKANDGTADSNTVTVSLTVTAPAANTALQLNGSSQYATLGASGDLQSATFTVELWFQRTGAGTPTSTGTGGITNAIPLITKGRAEAETAAADVNYFLGIDATSGKLVADFEEGQSGSTPSANHPITGTTAIPIGSAWHHAAATYDGAAWNLYLDGALDGTLTVNKPANAATTSRTAVGSALTTAGVAAGFFAGVVDEVRIWNSARTLAQIQATKNTEITAPQSGLLGVWNLNEGTGSSLADNSGNGKTGAAIASPAWVAGFVPPAGNGAPAAPTLNAPANGGTGVGLSPTLDIGVSDPDSDPLTVTYFGRPLASGNFAQIALHTGVASGSSDTASWAGLGAGQSFEWYATVSDGTHTTTGPTWTFHTTRERRPGLRRRRRHRRVHQHERQ